MIKRFKRFFTLISVCLMTWFISHNLSANDTLIFKAVGTWGYFTNYQKHEGPFWNQHIAEVSDRQIIGEITPHSELDLQGYEIMRLVKNGVFDFAFGMPGYVTPESAIFEGGDLSSLAQNISVLRRVSEAYFPTLERAFAEKYNAKLMLLYPFPSQMIWCKQRINNLGDLKGKRVRVYLETLGDFIDGIGAVPVNVRFNDVPQALQQDAIDCVITGTMSAYTVGLHKYTPYGFTLRVGWGLSFGAMNLNKWHRLNDQQKQLLQQEIAILNDNMWKETATEDAVALACLSNGPCELGSNGGMTLVKPSAQDLLIRDRVAKEVILPRWAERCGPECAANWNRTVGKVLDLTAQALP